MESSLMALSPAGFVSTPSARRPAGATSGMSLEEMAIATPILSPPPLGDLEAIFSRPSSGTRSRSEQRGGASNPATPDRSNHMSDVSLDPIHLSFGLGMELDDGLGDFGIADVDMGSIGSGTDGIAGDEDEDVEEGADAEEIDEDTWYHMITELGVYYHLYSHSNVSPADDNTTLELFVRRIRRGRSLLSAERVAQLAELSFRYELDADDADWYDNLQAIHRHISIVGPHRIDDIEDQGLLRWLDEQRTGFLGLDHAAVGHDHAQTIALQRLDLDWLSLSLTDHHLHVSV